MQSTGSKPVLEKYMSRVAVLDLGTNTFHLLIADVGRDQSFHVLFRAEEFVSLGEEGVERIGDLAFQRGIEQIRKYKTVIDDLKPERIIGFGTAAIRKSSNGEEFVRAVKEIIPMDLNKISGDEEAELIYQGVRRAVRMDDHPALIMDIGGGSTEFIIASRNTVFWKQSFPVGGSVLRQRFHQREPISAIEQVNLIHYLQHELEPLMLQLKQYPVKRLIGASGSFDTMAQMIAENIYSRPLDAGSTCTEISLRDFYIFCDKVIRANREERVNMKGLIWYRVDTIVPASILAGYVVESAHVHHITRSAYALKEGALWQLMQSPASEL